jgi:hypothetical protein
MGHRLELSEEERQMLLMALAHLAIERPRWNSALSGIALRVDNQVPALYEEFKRLRLRPGWNSTLSPREPADSVGASAINEELLIVCQVLFDQIDGDPRACQFFDERLLPRAQAIIAKARTARISPDPRIG